MIAIFSSETNATRALSVRFLLRNHRTQIHFQRADLSFFTGSAVFFFCDGVLDSDSFLLLQTHNDEIPPYLPASARRPCTLLKPGPLGLLVHGGSLWRRRRVEVERERGERSVGVRRLFSEREHTFERPAEGRGNATWRGNPDLAGGGRRWGGGGATGALASAEGLLKTRLRFNFSPSRLTSWFQRA